MRLRRLLRDLLLVLAVPAAGCAVQGCAVQDGAATSSDDVVSLPHTDSKNQSIGNCWLYATASWVEALHNAATGEAENLSESYWSYWHWYLQILWSADAAPGTQYADLKEVQTGGFFWEASYIMEHFGAMREGDFIPEEATATTSRRQSTAVAAINRSLREGALKDPAARRDYALIRQEMDAAWQLSPEVVARLDEAFGRNLERWPAGPHSEAAKVLTPQSFLVASSDATTHEKKKVPLLDVLPVTTQGAAPRARAWQEVYYPASPEERRAFLTRAQRALHDGVPPLLTFTVDFNAMRGSTFADIPASPGRQGGHMVAMSDYEIENVPGFGTLKAGVNETRPEALEAALSPEATITFLRVKNSWGPTGAGAEFSVSGHYDLYMKYLNGPIKSCLQPDGSTNRDDCRDETPFTSLVLPAGY